MTKSKHDWVENLKRNEEKFIQNACLTHDCSRFQAQKGAGALNKMYELNLMPKEVFNDQDGFNAARAVLIMIENGVIEISDTKIPATEISASKEATTMNPQPLTETSASKEATPTSPKPATETSASRDAAPTSPRPVRDETTRWAVRNPSQACPNSAVAPERANISREINARDGPPKSGERIQADSGEKTGSPVSDTDKPLVIAESETKAVNQEIPLTSSSSTIGQDEHGDQLMKDQMRELKLDDLSKPEAQSLSNASILGAATEEEFSSLIKTAMEGKTRPHGRTEINSESPQVGSLKSRATEETSSSSGKQVIKRHGMEGVRTTPKGPSAQLTGKTLSKKFKEFNAIGGDRVIHWIRKCCEAAKLDPDDSANFTNADGEVMTDGQISAQVDAKIGRAHV